MGLGVLAGSSAVGLVEAFAQTAPVSTAAEGMDDIVQKALSDAPADSVPLAAPAASVAPVADAAPEAVPTVAAGITRVISLHNLHTDEKLEAVYFDKGAYVPDALQALNKLMRDHRTNAVYAIDPKLFDLLVKVRAAVDSKGCFEVISGYRCPVTNAALHAKSAEVAVHSLHTKGMASDVRIGDVQLDHLQKAALALRGGGVGLYPVSDFVHVDVGPVRQWKGT